MKEKANNKRGLKMLLVGNVLLILVGIILFLVISEVTSGLDAKKTLSDRAVLYPVPLILLFAGFVVSVVNIVKQYKFYKLVGLLLLVISAPVLISFGAVYLFTVG